MESIRIKVVKLGKQKHEVLFKKLKNYKSKLFTVDIFEKSRPDCDYEWGYKFETLKCLLESNFDNKKYDLCIGFVDTIIENNYFGEKLKDNNIYIISFYQVGEFLKNENIDVFNYMITTIYRFLTEHNINGMDLSHHETKGCIFDMCGDKADIIYLTMKPYICQDCKVKLRTIGIQQNYYNRLKKEISKIKKSNYYKISDFIKVHPYLSILIGVITSLLINLLSNCLYDFIKQLI